MTYFHQLCSGKKIGLDTNNLKRILEEVSLANGKFISLRENDFDSSSAGSLLNFIYKIGMGSINRQYTSPA